VLTAAAASLGMIPIASEVFWAPMAYAIIGGLFVATLLTLLFLPALYVAWFRAREPRKEPKPGLGAGIPNLQTNSSGSSTILRVIHSGGMVCHRLRHHLVIAG
jgi:hypothetical protein